jgi:hypothetical protein
MPNKEKHLQQALHNRAFYNTLTNPQYLDWSVNVLFYTALQYIDAYLATVNVHPSNHADRLKWVSLEHNIKSVYGDYQRLKDESESGRYLAKRFTIAEVKSLEMRCDRIKNHTDKLFNPHLTN